MNFNLNGKTALVTGGSRGLGKAMAIALADAGANVAIMSRTLAELEKAAEEIKQHTETVLYASVDVQKKEQVNTFIEEIVAKTGGIDILVNAAGINIRHDFLNFPEEDWDKVMNVNVKSVFLLSQAVIPFMQKRGGGKIINIASLTSEIGFKNMAAYVASKGAISQLTKAMAVEFAQDNIHVNAIGPGYFETELTQPLFKDEEKVKWMKSRIPLDRIGQPEELQGATVFLATDASKYITGQTIYVDGGWLIS